jgi:hypothetical protein
MNARLRTVLRSLAPALLAFAALGAQAQAQAQVQAQVQTPRFALWLTGPIGATNAAHCQLDAAALRAWSPTDGRAPLITEDDIASWDASRASWTLDARKLDELGGAIGITDRCFVLAIDGQAFASGAVLLAFSARLLRFPTIAVEPRGGAATFQLRREFGGTPVPLGQAELDRVLRKGQ